VFAASRPHRQDRGGAIKLGLFCQNGARIRLILPRQNVRGDQIGFVLPKLSACQNIALQHYLSDHAAAQQMGASAMVVRWNALLLAAVVAGGSMLIESSHRLDTGAPDDQVVASSTCHDDQLAMRYGWNRRALVDSDDGVEVAGGDADKAQMPPGCPGE
jgi:hypothetical protein